VIWAGADREPISYAIRHLDLSDEEAADLTRELTELTWSDRYPLSPRIKTLSAIPRSSDRSRFASPCRHRNAMSHNA
jgi:hypothetical protein